jgi:hypothetical protein
MVGEKTEKIDARIMEIALWEGSEIVYDLAKENAKLKKQNLVLQKENMALKHLILEERHDRAEMKRATAVYKRMVAELESSLKGK